MLLAPDQKFRVGYQLMSWGRYYPENWWGGCRDLAALGFPGVEGESTISHLYEGRWEEFRRRMQKFELQLAALYSTSDLQKKEESYQNLTPNLQAAEFLQAMGGRVLMVGGSETHNPTSDDFHRMADTANELGRRALERYGIKVGFHPHLGNMILYREDIGRLMELTDPRYFFLAPVLGRFRVQELPAHRRRAVENKHVHGRKSAPDAAKRFLDDAADPEDPQRESG